MTAFICSQRNQNKPVAGSCTGGWCSRIDRNWGGISWFCRRLTAVAWPTCRFSFDGWQHGIGCQTAISGWQQAKTNHNSEDVTDNDSMNQIMRVYSKPRILAELMGPSECCMPITVGRCLTPSASGFFKDFRVLRRMDLRPVEPGLRLTFPVYNGMMTKLFGFGELKQKLNWNCFKKWQLLSYASVV